MGVYIKGMSMPVFEHDSWDIREGTDGKWYMVDTNAETTDGEWHEIVPVPPHGRLIDADAAAKQGWTINRTYSASPTETVYEVKTITDEVLPTVIDAEEDEG